MGLHQGSFRTSPANFSRLILTLSVVSLFCSSETETLNWSLGLLIFFPDILPFSTGGTQRQAARELVLCRQKVEVKHSVQECYSSKQTVHGKGQKLTRLNKAINIPLTTASFSSARMKLREPAVGSHGAEELAALVE